MPKIMTRTEAKAAGLKRYCDGRERQKALHILAAADRAIAELQG
jgi:hypothetical protein